MLLNFAARAFAAAPLLISVHPGWCQSPTTIPAAGLWEIRTGSSMGWISVELCSDGKTAPDFLGVRARATPLEKCKRDAVRSEGKTAIYRTVCHLDASTRAETVARISGDFKTTFSIEQTTRTELKGAEPVQPSLKSSGNRVGTCVPNMEPGDLRMPDGTVIKPKKRWSDR